MNTSDALRWLKSKRVAVLKGGWSKERSISLKSGAAVEASFKRLGIRFKSIDVKPNIAKVLSKFRIQFCFLCLHGPFGEDGRIQGLLDTMGILYTGEGALPSAFGMNKDVSKALFEMDDVPTPPWLMVSRDDLKSKSTGYIPKLKSLLAKGPVFVKPVDQGSAIGISKVENLSALPVAIKSCTKISRAALIEAYIPGREFTVGILGDTPLPVIEIIPEHSFYDFHSKYVQGGSRHILPAPLSISQTMTAQKTALAAYRSIFCSVYARVDLMLDKKDKFWVLEVNTIPGMTNVSLLPEAAKYAGSSFDDLVLKITALSLRKRSNRE